jgi:hypothetical protein
MTDDMISPQDDATPDFGDSGVASSRPPISSHEQDDLIEVHVLGFTNSRREAPWDRWQEPGLEIWGLNNLHIAQADTPTDRCARWFDLHPGETIVTDTAHMEWMRQQKRPIYLFEKAASIIADPDKGNVSSEWLRVFPEVEVETLFGTEYFTNSISWELAFAGLALQPALRRWKQWQRIEGLAFDGLIDAATAAQLLAAAGIDTASPPPQPKIGVWGVDMATDTEYGAQRPSCEWFLGVLQGAGFAVQIPMSSDLLRSAGKYGTDHNGALRAKMSARREELQSQMQGAQTERAQVTNRLGQLDGQIAHIQGAIADVTYWLDRWTMPGIDRDSASKEGQI